MSNPAVEIGDKLHIITRRRFEDDVRRHFAGEVVGISGNLQKLVGYTFIFMSGTNDYRRIPESRTRIFFLGEEGLIVNVIPPEVDISSLDYRVVNKHLAVIDGKKFSLDINEFGEFR